MSLRYLSVCSGIEAATVAWHPLGWTPIAFSEIEPFPSAVLAHHYPTVPNLGDMCSIAVRVMRGEIEAPDVVVGGTPCQAFSIAGNRESLNDDRGNLTLRFAELVDAIDAARVRDGESPCIVVWENVPGVLSTHDNAFGCFLARLAGEDDELQPAGRRWANAGCVYGPRRAVAWRILDAQYFGLPQRRRRVFVVSSARDGFDPAEVFFEWQGLRRDTPPRRGSTENVAGTIAGGSRRCGGISHDDIPAVAVSYSLRADAHRSGMAKTPSMDAAGAARLRHAGFNVYEEIAPTLDCGVPGSVYTSREAVNPLAFSCKDFGGDAGETAPTLRAMGHSGSRSNAGGQVAVAFAQNSRDEVREMHVVGALAAQPGAKQTSYLRLDAAVRRLTPVECERLQGFPDNYTRVPVRKCFAADGPRYRALGNSMAVPCMRWLGRRIELVVAGRERIAA